MIYEDIATKLQLSPQELEHESLKVFLQHRLRLVESQLLSLSQKYGVNTVTELDSLIRSGGIHEAEAFEDFFSFDHLEAERDAILEAIKTLNAAE